MAQQLSTLIIIVLILGGAFVLLRGLFNRDRSWPAIGVAAMVGPMASLGCWCASVELQSLGWAMAYGTIAALSAVVVFRQLRLPSPRHADGEAQGQP